MLIVVTTFIDTCDVGAVETICCVGVACSHKIILLAWDIDDSYSD